MKERFLRHVSIQNVADSEAAFPPEYMSGYSGKISLPAAGAWTQGPCCTFAMLSEKTGGFGKLSSALPVCISWPAGKICSGAERLQSPPPPAGLLAHSRSPARFSGPAFIPYSGGMSTPGRARRRTTASLRRAKSGRILFFLPSLSPFMIYLRFP